MLCDFPMADFIFSYSRKNTGASNSIIEDFVFTFQVNHYVMLVSQHAQH